jgi:hypothetical protein
MPSSYQYNPPSTVLLETLIVSKLVRKISVLYGTRRVIIIFTRGRKMTLLWASWILSTSPHPISSRPILMLPSHLLLGLLNGLFPSGFPTKILYLYSTQLTTKPVTGHDAEPVSSTSDTHIYFCKIQLLMLSFCHLYLPRDILAGGSTCAVTCCFVSGLEIKAAGSDHGSIFCLVLRPVVCSRQGLSSPLVACKLTKFYSAAIRPDMFSTNVFVSPIRATCPVYHDARHTVSRSLWSAAQ